MSKQHPENDNKVKLEKLRYPIGKFQFGLIYSEDEINKFIEQIDKFPAKLKKLVTGMKKEQLETPYRENGWTIRQVIHHVADSHMNAYIRFRWALTENNPTIKPYYENFWAELEDAKHAPISISLALLTNLHKRWVMLLKSMTSSDFHKSLFHPDLQHYFKLTEMTAHYAWHGEHHYQHIQQLMKIKKW